MANRYGGWSELEQMVRASRASLPNQTIIAVVSKPASVLYMDIDYTKGGRSDELPHVQTIIMPRNRDHDSTQRGGT